MLMSGPEWTSDSEPSPERAPVPVDSLERAPIPVRRPRRAPVPEFSPKRAPVSVSGPERAPVPKSSPGRASRPEILPKLFWLGLMGSGRSGRAEDRDQGHGGWSARAPQTVYPTMAPELPAPP